MESGMVVDPADVFDPSLTVEKLMTLDRFAEKSATNLHDRIKAARARPLGRILHGLGIRHVGDSTADDLARWLRARLGPSASLAAVFDALRAATVEDLQAIDGVGDVVADAIREYFAKPDERPFLDKLVAYGVSPVMPEPLPERASGPFAGTTVVFTGTLVNRTRDEAEAMVRAAGGKTSDSISKKTDLLVAGTKSGSKLEKARQLGINVVDEAGFEALIGLRS